VVQPQYFLGQCDCLVADRDFVLVCVYVCHLSLPDLSVMDSVLGSKFAVCIKHD